MKILLSCLLVALFASCNQSSSKSNVNDLDLLADRTCHAIGIRQQRFSLANKIRFAQDTLFHVKSKADSTRLQNELKVCLKQKDSLLKASLALADTIRHQLDTMIPYTDKNAQKKFTDQLNALLDKKGCRVTTKEDNLPEKN